MPRRPNLFHYVNYIQTDARITGGKFKTQTYGVGGGLLVSAGPYRLHASTWHCRTELGGSQSCVGALKFSRPQGGSRSNVNRVTELNANRVTELNANRVTEQCQQSRSNATENKSWIRGKPQERSQERRQSPKQTWTETAKWRRFSYTRFPRQMFQANQSDFSRSAQNLTSIIWGRSCTVAECSLFLSPHPDLISQLWRKKTRYFSTAAR